MMQKLYGAEFSILFKNRIVLKNFNKSNNAVLLKVFKTALNLINYCVLFIIFYVLVKLSRA